MNSEKMTFDLPPNFGDGDTINMIRHRLWKFHGRSLHTAKQKAIVWLHSEDFRNAEIAYANNSVSAQYIPPLGDIRYFPLGNDKVISSSQCKRGVMEIEGVNESSGDDLIDALVYSLLWKNKTHENK